MFNRRCAKKRCLGGTGKTFGIILISVGTGLFLAYIIPYYMLITLLGLSLIVAGICNLLKK